MKTKPPKKISIDKDAPCHFTYKELKELKRSQLKDFLGALGFVIVED